MLRLKEAEIERINAEVRRLKKRYAEAESEFEDAIEKIYAKYADENGIIDVNIAKAFLTGKETDITLKEYEKLVKESLENGNFEAERILQGWAKRERITRLDQMKLETDLIAKKLYEDTEGTLTKALGKSGRESYLMSAYELQKGLKNWSPMYAPSASYFEALARQQYNGKDFSERLWGHINNFSDVVHNVVKTSIIHGYGVDKAVKLMAGEVVADRKHIERLIRTEIARVQEQATLESYEVNEVTKYRFLATLDLKTSKQCQSLDMKVFDLTKDQTFSVDYGGKVGKVTYNEKGGVVGVNYPPMHPYCRSTTVPYVEDYTPSSRTSRDPLTGKEKKVRGDMTYAEWYKEYVEDAPLGKWAEKHKDKLPSDMRQWERYKARLKGGVPDSFDKFIELKYGDDQEKWLKVQLDYRDTGQLEKFNEVLGNDSPKTLEKLQDIKYNNPKEFALYEADYKRRAKLLKTPKLELPNINNAVMADAKFTRYLFGGDNDKGLIKGKNIENTLGYNISNWEQFRDEISRLIKVNPSKNGGINSMKDGYRYEQYIIIHGKNGRLANIKLGWNVVGNITSLSTLFIEELKK